MKFTIVTVSYNAADTIEDTIISVSSQKEVDFEYIIIDGGSSDGTVQIIKKHFEKGNISYWVSEPDRGVYDAMNKALGLANGHFLIFMGADDVFYDDKVLKKVGTQIRDKSCIYYGRVQKKNSGCVSRGKVKNALDLCRENICHQSIFYPIDIYKCHDYKLKYKIYADFVYNQELYSKYYKKFIYMDLIISIFNENGISGLHNDKAFEKDRCEIARKLFGFWLGGILWLGLRTKAFFRHLNFLKR